MTDSESRPRAPGASPLPPPPGQQPYVQAPERSNGLATAALVLGIIGVFLFWTVWAGLLLGTLAIIFGAIGRSNAKHGAPNQGSATAGLVLGIVSVLASISFLVFIISVAGEVGDLFDEIQSHIELCLDNPDAPAC
jgi:hypothetical protein